MDPTSVSETDIFLKALSEPERLRRKTSVPASLSKKTLIPDSEPIYNKVPSGVSGPVDTEPVLGSADCQKIKLCVMIQSQSG